MIKIHAAETASCGDSPQEHPPEAEPCDRIEEARGVRLSSRLRKTYELIGELGAFSPGLKPGHCKIKRSRGFENPLLPRTEVRGWHSLSCSLIQRRQNVFRRPILRSRNVETPDPALRAGLLSGRPCGTKLEV